MNILRPRRWVMWLQILLQLKYGSPRPRLEITNRINDLSAYNIFFPLTFSLNIPLLPLPPYIYLWILDWGEASVGKELIVHAWGLSSNAQSLCTAGTVECVHDASTPVMRQEARTGESLEDWELASLVYQVNDKVSVSNKGEIKDQHLRLSYDLNTGCAYMFPSHENFCTHTHMSTHRHTCHAYTHHTCIIHVHVIHTYTHIQTRTYMHTHAYTRISSILH